MRRIAVLVMTIVVVAACGGCGWKGKFDWRERERSPASLKNKK